MKNYINKAPVGLILVLGLVVFSMVFMFNKEIVKAAALYYTPSTQYSVASTTASYIIGGTGTTTKTFISDGVEQVTWLVALASSTTPPTLCWTNQYSNNGTDWYYGTTTTPASSQECWTYATTSASTIISRGSDNKTLFLGRRVVVSNLDTQYTRTSFSIDPGVSALVDIQRSLKNTVIRNK